MSNVQSIVYRLVGIDAASPAFDKAGLSAGRAEDKIGKLGKAMTKVGIATAAAATAIAIESVKAATTFQASMERISTQAGASQKSVKLLSAEVLNLGTKTQQGPQELALALYHLKSVGLGNAQAMKALKTASDLAAVGGANLEDVTNALAGAWRSGIKGAQSFGETAATANAVIGAGNMTMQQFTAALGTGILPAARTFGLSLTSVGSALALMTDEGVKAAAAGTRLKTALSIMAAPSAAASAQLKTIGLTGLQLANAMRSPGGLVSAIALLKTHLDASGLSASQAAILLSKAFGGGRTAASIETLLNNLDVLRRKQQQINDTTDKYGQAVVNQQKTASAQFAILKSNIDVIGIRIGTALLPPVTKFTAFLADKVVPGVARDASAILKLGLVFAGLMVTVKAVTLAFKAFSVVSAAAGGIGAAVTGMRAFTSASVAAATAQKAILAATTGTDGAMTALSLAQARLTLAAKGSAASQVGFAVATDGTVASVDALTISEKAAAIAGAALDAVNPFVWVAGAIVAVAALTYAMSKLTTSSQATVNSLATQDKATGFNLAGYQKLNAQLTQTITHFQGIQKSASGANAQLQGRSAGIAAAEVQGLTGAQQQMLVTANNLTNRLNSLEGAYGLSAKGAELLASKAGVSASQLTAAGSAGYTAFNRITQYANGEGAAALAAIKLHDGANDVANALDKVNNKLLIGQGDLVSWRQAQQQATKAIADSSTGLKGNSAAALNAKAATLQATDQAISYATHEATLNGGMKTATGTIQEQIRWLQKHGDKAQWATQEIDQLRIALAKIKSETATIAVKASGQWTVTKAGSTPGIRSTAAGWKVSGGIPGVDSVPILAMPGETVVSVAHSKQLADVFSAIGVPGYASGGVVGSLQGNPKAVGKFAVSKDAATLKAVEASTAAAATAGIKAAARASAPGLLSSGSAVALGRVMAAAVGWTGAQFTALNELWTRESGWNDRATNAASGAYGIPQALPASKMATAGADYLTDAATQIKWGLAYIKGRYVNPVNAWAHEEKFGWYAKGTRGAAPGWAWVGERGPELVRFGGGETVLSNAMSRLAAGTARGYATGTDDALIALGKQLMKKHHSGELDSGIRAAQIARSQDKALSAAPGLSAAEHHRYAALAAAAAKRVGTLTHDRAAVGAYRTQLQGLDKTYAADIAAAKAHKLASEVARLRKLVAADKKTIAAIDLWTAGSKGFPGPGAAKAAEVAGRIAAGKALMRKTHTGVLDTEIPAALAARQEDLALAKAPGLSAGQHAHYKKLAAQEAARLKVLTQDRADVRAYRTSLRVQDKAYKLDIKAAKAHGLTKEVTRLTKLLTANQKTVASINMWTAGVAAFKAKGSGSGSGTGSDDTSGDSSTATAPPPVITATDVASVLSSYMPFAQTYQFRRGTWSVPSTGPATVHQGEMIFPAELAGQIRQAISNGTGGGAGRQENLLGQILQAVREVPTGTGDHLGRLLNNQARKATPRGRPAGSPFG